MMGFNHLNDATVAAQIDTQSFESTLAVKRMLIVHTGLEKRERDLPRQRTIVVANMSDCNKDTNKRYAQMFVTVAVKSFLAHRIAKQLQPEYCGLL